MLKLPENHVKTQLYERFFHIFELGNILKILFKKKNFCQKITFLSLFGTFWS